LSYNNILVEQQGGVGVVTLNRPQVLNALSSELMSELLNALDAMDADPEVKAIVVTGSGEKAFSAGADIHEMARMNEEQQRQREEEGESSDRYWRIAALTKPTIGAINGLAYGGGALMSSCFDMRVGCERTRFRYLAVSYGRVNSSWSLPIQVGMPMAKELLFTGRVVTAEEAYRIGLLNRLVPADQLLPTAMEIAQAIAANDPRMVQGIKELLYEDIGAPWKDRYSAEQKATKDKLKAAPVEESFKGFLDRKGRKE